MVMDQEIPTRGKGLRLVSLGFDPPCALDLHMMLERERLASLLRYLLVL